ncbi:unnamed protein product [Pylaiella littoralis]
MVQDHRDRALSTRPSPYTHPIARASTGLALGVRSSTITGPAGGEGRRPNRQRGRTTDAGIYPHARQDRKRGESTTAHDAIAEHAGLGGKQGGSAPTCGGLRQRRNPCVHRLRTLRVFGMDLEG